MGRLGENTSETSGKRILAGINRETQAATFLFSPGLSSASAVVSVLVSMI